MTENQRHHEAAVFTWARRVVYERLAFISAAVWACGTFLLFVNLVPPDITKPVPQIVVAMMLPIIPAALPWLFYPAISRAVARRRLAQERPLSPPPTP
jgi:hypothetical protein